MVYDPIPPYIYAEKVRLRTQYPFGLKARVVYPQKGIWITNGRVAWRVPAGTVAAWLTEGVLPCPEGWWVEENCPEGIFDTVMGGDMVHCIQEVEWREVE
jgi:hypothetical protein